MGNTSCCFKRRHENGKKKNISAYPVVAPTITKGRELSVNFLPHISEREIADNADEDPSTHPSVQPTFVERSKSESRLKDNRRSMYVLDNIATPSSLKKSNSCSTIFLDDSTISQPHLKNTIICISLAIYYHIKNRKNRSHERLMEIFEERLHPISAEPVSFESFTRDPELKHIYRFIRSLFNAAQLTAECAIITLVYVERLLNYAEIDLCPSNWRRVLLGAIMLASKVWDDQAVWNVDYCQIMSNTSVDDMNELERQFLECLEFNINVPSSVYAKYYYDLRSLAMTSDFQLPILPLYKDRATRLEALSRNFEERVMSTNANLVRSRSVECVKGHHGTPVVIP